MTYPSDINDIQFKLIEKYFIKEKGRGRKREIPIIIILNAIFYLVKSGCQWRMLPNDFPNWKTVYHYFSLWTRNGLIEKIHADLRRQARRKEGKEETPSLGIVDSQCVQTTMLQTNEKGYSGNKRIKGRKRTILVDSLGLIWSIDLSGGNISEIEGAIKCLFKAPKELPRLQKILFDAGYKGEWFLKFIEGMFGCSTEIVEKMVNQIGFVVQANRWIVERTFAWFGGYRRLNKDFEVLISNSESMILVSMSRLILNRLA